MSSTLAPILGFLGTVTGMIRAFEAIAAAGEVEPTVVASGISEALITTAAGLFIAAPMVLFHTLFTQMTDRYSRDMEQAATSLVDHLLEKGLLKG
jgi:biopolymer transport protein ExbB